MNLNDYLKTYYSNSPNSGTLDQLKNFGSEIGGGKAALNGLITGITAPVKVASDLWTIGSNKAIGALIGKDMTPVINKRLNDSNNFFSNDSLIDSVNEHPMINSLANYGTSLAGGLASKLPVRQITGNFIDKSIVNEYKNQRQPMSINLVGSSVLNGVGNIVKQPIKAINYGLNNLTGAVFNQDRTNKLNSDQKNIDNFFNFS